MGVATTAVESTAYAIAGILGSYTLFVAVLTIPFFQNQVIYLNKVTLTWGQDVNYPEQWGFLHNQVTPFHLNTSDGETLHAWHVLPLGQYLKHEGQLAQEPSGLAPDITLRRSFKLLKEDPDALLVLYFHGAAGTLAAGCRPPSYRVLSALDPQRIHVVALDYRGFGTSTGEPSEEGLLEDALTLARWAMQVAEIPPSRIVLFAQSLGTAVATSLVDHLSRQPEPVSFSGMVYVAPFTDVELLTATYRIAGAIPVLGPVAKFPTLMTFLNKFIRDKWLSKDRLAAFVRSQETASEPRPEYWINLIHGQDDYDIPWSHSELLYWHAVNATVPTGISYEDLEKQKSETKTEREAGGWSVERRTNKGLIRQDILVYGLHDRTMEYPAVSMAIWRAFHHRDR